MHGDALGDGGQLADKPVPAEVTAAPPEDRRGFSAKAASDDSPSEAPADEPAADEAPAEPAQAAGSSLSKEPQKLASSEPATGDDESEVDRVLLAQEFSGLLQMDDEGAEGNS